MNYNLPVVSSSFDTYLREISKYPSLDASDIYELFELFEKTNDSKYIQKIILHHLKFVVYISKRYMNYGVSISELVQEGNIGLMIGIKKFDYKKAKSENTGLITYVVHDIKSKILDYIVKSYGPLKSITTKDHRKIFFNKKIFNQYDFPLSNDSIKSIAAELDVSVKSVKEMEYRFNSNHLLLNDEEELTSYVTDNKDPVVILEQYENDPEDKIKSLLQYLNERERDIIIQRWLSTSKASLIELGEKYNVSYERIRQIEKIALNKMREHNESID